MASRRNKLNNKQIKLLKLLYKFRFVSSKLVAIHKDSNSSVVNRSLAILLEQGLVRRRYDKSYKLSGKGAFYYLTPYGLRLLQDKLILNDQVLYSIYKNESVSDCYVDEHIDIMQVYLALRSTYPDTFNIFTKYELGSFDYFPVPKPSLYLSRRISSNQKQNNFMLDVINDNRLFIIKKRIQTYVKHYESGDWGEETYPKVLLVCLDTRAEIKTQKYLDSLLMDIDVFTTNKKALIAANKHNFHIWSNEFEPKVLYSMTE